MMKPLFNHRTTHRSIRMNRHLFILACALSAQILVHGQSFVTIDIPFDPTLAVVRTTNQIEVTWWGEGILEQASSPEGSWTPVATNSSSWLAPEGQSQGCYRVRNPRPQSVQLFVPPNSGDGSLRPLLILLHGYSGNGPGVENYMKFLPQAQEKEFFYCYPDGVASEIDPNLGWVVRLDSEYEPEDTRYVDHVAILRSLIKEIIRTQPVDPQRVFVMGHSNGGEMAYRMAHEEAGLIASVVSFAGPDTSLAIPPSSLVNVLHIHGTADGNIFYNGGSTTGGVPNPYPGVFTLIEGWANYSGASGFKTDTQRTLDLIGNVAGLDTIVTRYTNAPAGGTVELWSIQGGTHAPSLTSAFAPAVADWLLSRPRPVQ